MSGPPRPGVLVAFTHYPTGEAEQTLWTYMPAVPETGHTVHLNFDRPAELDGTRAFEVRHVSWAQDKDYPNWHAEIGLR